MCGTLEVNHGCTWTSRAANTKQRGKAATKRFQPRMDTEGHGFYGRKQGKRRVRKMGAEKCGSGWPRNGKKTGKRAVKFHRGLRTISTIAVRNDGGTESY